MATVLVAVLAIAVLAVVGLWILGGPYVAEKTTDLANRHLFSPDTRLSAGSIGGFLLNQINLTAPAVQLQSDKSWFSFARAQNVQIIYDLWGALHQRYVASRVDVEGFRLELRSFDGGAIRVPGTRGSGSGDGADQEGDPIRFWIKSLNLENASLYLDLPFRALEIDSINAELSVSSDRDGLRIEVKYLSGHSRDNLGLLVIHGGTVRIGESVWLEDFSGIWAGSSFTVSGSLDPILNLQLQVQNLPLERLGRFINEDGLSPGHVDRVEGRIFSEGDLVAFEWTGAASWDSWHGETVSGRGEVTTDSVRLRDITARIEGTQVTDGRIQIPLQGPGLAIQASFSGLHTKLLRIPELEPYPGILSGSGSLTLTDRTDPLRHADATVELGPGHLLEVPFGDGHVSLQIREGAWNLDTLRVRLEEAVLEGQGTVGEETMDLAFAYTGDLKPWRRFLRRNELSGIGRLQVLLTGPTRRPILSARGGLSNLEVATIRAPEVELEQAVGIVANQRDLTIGFVAPEGVWVGPTFFSRGAGQLHVTEDRLIMERLQLDRGDTTVTVAGNLRWDPFVQIEMEQAEVVFEGRKFELTSPGELSIDQDVLSSTGIGIQTPRGEIHLRGSWDTKTNYINTTCRVDGLDPSVFFPSHKLPELAVGKATGVVEVAGMFPRLEGHVVLGLREVDWERGHIDSLTLELRVQDSTLSVTRLEPIVSGGRMVTFGNIRLPMSVHETVEALAAGNPIDPERIELDLGLSVVNVDVAKWRFLLPDQERVGGKINASFEISGTSAHPRISFDGEATHLAWRRLQADRLRVKGRYGDAWVEVDTLVIWQGEKSLEVEGGIPLNVTLYPFSWSLPETSMDLTLRADDGGLESLKLTPWIKKASGRLRALVHIKGTPKAPLLVGDAHITGGRVELEERDEILENISAVIRFDNDVVVVEEARCGLILPWLLKDPKKGKVSAEGTYRLGAREEDTYELGIHCVDALVGQEGEYAARVSGDLTLVPKRAGDGKIYPFASGSLFASRVEYAGSIEPQDIGTLEPQSILYDIDISAPDKVFLQVERINAVLGGDLNVRQEWDRQIIAGEMEILRGNYEFFQKTFRVTDGKFVWDDRATILPEMEITAEAKESGILIVVDLEGRIDRPLITFSARRLADGSSAGLSQEEIIELLLVGASGLGAFGLTAGVQDTDILGPSQTDKAVIGVSKLVLGPLERELLRQIGLVDEIQLETESEGGELEPRIGLKKWLTSEFSVQVSQGLNRDYRQDIGVEYRLGRIFFLRGTMIYLPLETGGTQEYNLDLKLRREY